MCVAFIGVLAAMFALALLPSAATATCVENGTIFWQSDTAGTAIGNQQAITSRVHSNGCTEANSTVAGDTVHVSGGPGGQLVEAGFRDKRNGSGTHYLRAFTEYCINGSCGVAEIDLGCMVDGAVLTYRVDQIGNRVWQFQRVCPGGSFMQLGSNTPQLTFGSGSPRVETFRFGPSGGGGYIQGNHANMYYHKNTGWVLGFGAMSCNQGMTDTRGAPGGGSNTSWSTTPVSGYFCP